MTTSTMNGPLNGIKVLDLSTAFSGPISSSVLIDQGAEVIKIETLGMGDLVRYSGASRNGMSGTFHFINRGKRSLAVNMKDAKGVELLKKLIADSDVVIQNFRHGVVERLGLDYEVAKAINPEIIYLSITGFGDRGPLADKPAYDNVMQAFAGFADLERTSSNGPASLVQNVVVDKITALYSAQAVTSALYARSVGQGGQHIQVSMLDCAVNFLWADSAMEHALPGDGVNPATPLGQMGFVTEFKNGSGTVSPVSDKAFHGMCKAFDVDSSDPRLKSGMDRMMNMDYMTAKISECAEKAAQFDADEAIAILQANDVPCAKVQSVSELPDHPQAHAVELFQRSQHPILGELIEPRPAARFSETAASIGGAAPTLGQHTHDILNEIGLGDDVALLRESGVIQ